MQDFLLKGLNNADIEKELSSIAFDVSYISQAANKFRYRNIKIFGLNAAQANILKQTALTVGADCATPRNTVTGMIESADCILGGSISQLQKIAVKLGMQPFGLRNLGRKLENFLSDGIKEYKKPQVMGILNLTQNSFSDGGEFYNYDDAISHLKTMISEGADIIDIGAESTKPYSKEVPVQAQLEKLLPVLDYITSNNINIPISIDTRSSQVARECLNAGATAINDVSGLDYDKEMVKVISDYGCPIIIQHSKGSPENMQDNPKYDNLMDEIYRDLRFKIDFAVENGVAKENIIVDPGIGFGKIREHNFEILKRLEELKGLDCPILIGLSRKSLLNMQNSENFEKDIYSLALNAIALNNGVNIIRVHNVGLHRKLIDMLYD